MKINIAAVDDLKTDRDILKSMTEKYFGDSEYSFCTFENAEEFLRNYTKERFHLVFLDICMDGMNGIELSKRLRSNSRDIQMIFVSTTTEYVFQTFSVQPFEYIIKPYTYERFSEVMNAVIPLFSESAKTIDIKLARSEISIPVNEIFSVVSDNHNIVIKTISGNTYNSIETFSCVTEKFRNEPSFIQCNRGIIINMDYAVSVKGTNFVMQDGTIYPIKVREKKSISDHFTAYTANKLKGGIFI